MRMGVFVLRGVLSLGVLSLALARVSAADASTLQAAQGQTDPAVEWKAAVDAELTKLRGLAEQGDAQMQYDLGHAYEFGEIEAGIAQNYLEAVTWYRKAAAQGHVEAQTALAMMYSNGKGVARNENEAFELNRQAADQGDARAQNNLGAQYYEGTAVSRDDVEAVKWYRKAAEQGFPRAQANLANMYDEGVGVQQNILEAMMWYTRAADNDDRNAQYAMAYMYHSGKLLKSGVATGIQDQNEALAWCRKAAEQGHPSAAYGLGLSYDLGEGVAVDSVEALRWFIIALEQASDIDERKSYPDSFRKGATDAKASLARKMTTAQVAEAEKRAREWRLSLRQRMR